MKKRWNGVRRLLGLAVVLALVLPFVGPAAVMPAEAVTQAEIDALKSDANDLASQKKELQAQLNEVKADKNEALKQKQLLEEQIEVIPTLVLYRDGKAVDSIVNPESKAAIEQFIRKALPIFIQ